MFFRIEPPTPPLFLVKLLSVMSKFFDKYELWRKINLRKWRGSQSKEDLQIREMDDCQKIALLYFTLGNNFVHCNASFFEHPTCIQFSEMNRIIGTNALNRRIWFFITCICYVQGVRKSTRHRINSSFPYQMILKNKLFQNESLFGGNNWQIPLPAFVRNQD